MSDELMRKVQRGDFTGLSWAGLTRLSTEESEGELSSDDPSGRPRYLTGKDIKSTDEQELDNRKYVEERGGRYVDTYTEPDTSAWKRKRVRLPDGQVVYRVIRPTFDAALADLKAGRAKNGEPIDGLIVLDLDRLTRDPRHLEDAIEVVQHYGRPIIDISGSLDLLTENGRAMARVITAMHNKSSADTSRRVARKHKAIQRNGIPAGGTRPFGWQEDRRTLQPQEAKLLQDAAKRMIEGGLWHAVVADWNRQGILTANGKPWAIRALKKVLTSPRICGYRAHLVIEFDPETAKESRRVVPVYDDDGKPVIGQHQPILTVAQWEAITAILEAGPGYGTGHNSRTYLGTGILRCDKDGCGAKLRGMKSGPSLKKPEGHFYYRCPGKLTGLGCGGVAVSGPETDELIKLLVLAKHDEENQRRQAISAPGEWQGEEDLARVREDIADAKAARKARQISAERYYSDLAEYEAEERKLLKDRGAWQRKALVTQGEPVDLAEEWDRDGITLAERRAYVERALSAILVRPVGRGSRTPLRDRLVPVYHTER